MAFLYTADGGEHDPHHGTDDDRSAKGIILADCVTAETAAALTGYNIQHIRRLAYDSRLEAVRVGRAWLIETRCALPAPGQRTDDGRYGPHRQATLSEAALVSEGNT
jgi:hypothetical protein